MRTGRCANNRATAMPARAATARNTTIANRDGTRRPSSPGTTPNNHAYGPLDISARRPLYGTGPSDSANPTRPITTYSHVAARSDSGPGSTGCGDDNDSGRERKKPSTIAAAASAMAVAPANNSP